MKRLLKHITLLAIAFSLVASTGCKPKPEPEDEHTQTLIFYFAGTSLSFYFYRNISAIKEALRRDIKGNSRVMLFFQQTEKASAEIIELTCENGQCEEHKLSTYALPNEMDADNLSKILKEIMRLAPADTYSLLIGSHGTGWVPMYASPYTSIVGSTERHHIANYWQRTGEEMTRYIGEDSNPQNAFDITTLAEAIALSGTKMEYILFDACFMANVESAYELRSATRYIVGSVCEIMGSGFPYTNALPHLLKNNGTTYDLDGACRAFNAFYDDNYGYSGSISLIDCSQLDALALKMKQVNNGAQRPFNLDELQFYEGQQRHIFFDLDDYVDAMCDDEALKASFTEQLDRTVVKRYTLDTYYSAYGISGRYPITSYSGLNTSAPSTVYVDDYKQTAWYKATH
ncbi:MAG: hypothetical protein IKY76_05630 [Alistipes sp.]|nr:hypothetical protein [Alistipes sp.]